MSVSRSKATVSTVPESLRIPARRENWAYLRSLREAELLAWNAMDARSGVCHDSATRSLRHEAAEALKDSPHGEDFDPWNRRIGHWDGGVFADRLDEFCEELEQLCAICFSASGLTYHDVKFSPRQPECFARGIQVFILQRGEGRLRLPQPAGTGILRRRERLGGHLHWKATRRILCRTRRRYGQYYNKIPLLWCATR